MPAVGATKDDRVAFTPGSQLVGELKRLERGRLYFKTDATDQIPIEWQKVTRLVSSRQVQIELTSGIRYLGHLRPAEPAQLNIQTYTTALKVPIADVVRITPIEETFRERWDVDLSAGFSFTKASELRQLNFGIDVEYTTETRRVQLTSELTSTNDSNNEKITQMATSLRNIRLRQNRWITAYLGSLERNDGLGLDLRTSIGFGIGRYLKQTNSTNFELLGALQVSREDIQGISSSETTIESFLSARFELFRYAEPE
ncbi:MAG: DUF481 domain-containing protein, partial [Gammaproteobacteria bacterium]|nr:DUF481 domain-containing protein [Gammaproteobacteria bacterium]